MVWVKTASGAASGRALQCPTPCDCFPKGDRKLWSSCILKTAKGKKCRKKRNVPQIEVSEIAKSSHLWSGGERLITRCFDWALAAGRRNRVWWHAIAACGMRHTHSEGKLIPGVRTRHIDLEARHNLVSLSSPRVNTKKDDLHDYKD